MVKKTIKFRGKITYEIKCGRERPVEPPVEPPSEYTDLALDDLVFLGYKRFDYAGLPDGALLFGAQNATMRRVGPGPDDVQFFLYSRYGGVVEHAYGVGVAPSLVKASAPLMSLVRDWGYPFGQTVWLNHTSPCFTQAGSQADGGLIWDETRNVLWGTYGDTYVPTDNFPGHHACKLNPDGTTSAYGPFKASAGSSHNRGGLLRIPQWFADDYLGGKNVGGFGTMNSGTSTMTQGLGFNAWKFVDPAGLTVNSVDINAPESQIDQQIVIINDEGTPRPTTTRFRTCGWNVPYDCRLGYGLGEPNGLWTMQAGSSALSENNSQRSCVWVDFTRPGGEVVRGVVWFGFMADQPPGYMAPGDVDGRPHVGYGNAFHAGDSGSSAAGFVDQHCCHGQLDARWQSTGPFAHYRDRKVWIEPISKMISLATGLISPYSSYPAAVEAARMADIHPDFGPAMTFDFLGTTSTFDETTGRIYTTMQGDPMPYLLVFQVQ